MLALDIFLLRGLSGRREREVGLGAFCEFLPSTCEHLSVPDTDGTYYRKLLLPSSLN